ncbi:MAG TPA: outer membrane beta-barrel protein [Bacteroidales bacterium]|nr:outer membrane beta-barrel protein [Bacteroidales bacterium]
MKYLSLVVLLILNLPVSGQTLYISTGLNLSFMNINVKNINEQERFTDIAFHFDFVNILYEKKINDHLSLKSGFYINQEKGHYIYKEQFYNGLIKPHVHEFLITSADIPVLVTYRNKKFNFNAGPFFGIGIVGKETGVYINSNYPPYLSPFEYGINISTGYGLEKWQMSCYLLYGGKPLPENTERIRNGLIGLNLARAIYLGKNLKQ